SFGSPRGFPPTGIVRLRLDFNPEEDLDVTKAEFLDQLSGDDRLGSKKAASDAVDAVLDAITGALAAGDEVSFTGFGKFHVAERGPRQGVNPRTGERITIPGGKVPRFSAGSALKTKVKGCAGAEFQVRRPADGARRRAPQSGLPRSRSRSCAAAAGDRGRGR